MVSKERGSASETIRKSDFPLKSGAETFFTRRLDPEPRGRRVFSFHRPETLLAWVLEVNEGGSTLAKRLREFPPLTLGTLWPAQFEANGNLEVSFAAGRRRSLVQMATGSGKTHTAVHFIYRLLKYGRAKRVLFLVDRGNLAGQTLGEFQQFVSPVNNYKFTEEYIVQRLTSNTLDTSARVVIGTIQRIYSMLRGEQNPAPDLDDLPIEAAETLFKKPLPVEYNPAFPIEEFDFIVTDECHRSIYHLWRQVLEYFDASLIGLTATPSNQTFGFFQQNLVMEYNHEKAVADGVNVGCDIYRIKTSITEGGSKVESGYYVDKRDRQTRKVRWEQLDEPITYDASDLDRDVVSTSQIRKVLTTFRDKVFTEMEQVNPGVKRKTRYVIVDAVGVCERVQTESRPLEKKPSVSFEKLLDAAALGTTEVAAVESLAGRLIRLERRFDDEVGATVVKTANGQTLAGIAKTMLAAIDPDGILAQAKQGKAEYAEPTDKEISAAREARIRQALAPLATNPDLRNLLKKIQMAAEQTIDISSQDELIYAGAAQRTVEAGAQLASSFRDFIERHQAEITALQLLYSRPYRQRLTEPMLKELAKKLREQHAAWTEDNLWNAFATTVPEKVRGRSQAGRFADLVALVRFELAQQPVLEPFAQSVTTRFNAWLAAKTQSGVGVAPLMAQDNPDRAAIAPFTPEQLSWLHLIRDHIATSLSFEAEDFESVPFNQLGGLGKAFQLFGEQLPKLLDELNEVLAA